MKMHKIMSQMKGQDKTLEKQANEVEIGNVPEKEFRIMVVKMIYDLGKRMEAKIENMKEMPGLILLFYSGTKKELLPLPHRPA